MSDPIHLLYAEDNPQDADLTRLHFEQAAADFQLEIVESGARCLERLAAEPFDLLLLDQRLPDMDGLDVLAKLRAEGQHLPVVMVTGIGDDETVARALRAGAADYVPKSAGYLDTLPGILRGVVARERKRRPLDEEGARRMQRILYVEPNPMDVELTRNQFAAHAPHLDLHSVAGAPEALALLAPGPGRRFDLVLTDLRLPGMNALEFIREALHRGIKLPFIVLTGRGDEATAVAILRLGAYDYIVKRENYLTKLPYAIEHALERFRLDQTTRRLHGELASLNAALEEKVAARTAELQREIEERKQLQTQNQQQLEELARGEAESRRLLDLAERSRRATLGVLEDQRLAEQALRESEQRFRLAAATGNVWDWNFLTNEAASPSEDWRLLGYDATDIKITHALLESIMHPDDRPRWRQAIKDHISRRLPYDLDFRARTKSGEYRWFNTKGQARWDENGHATYMAGTTFDITERKQAEAALRESRTRLEALTRRLLEVQETERRTLARELHDEVGGVLTAVKLNLQSLRRTPAGVSGEAALADGVALVDGAIQAVRSLSLELRPAVLDDLGLIPALKWYCERQSMRAGVAIEPALDAIDLQGRPQLESACFRIVQEALTNALRHAGARRIQVALKRSGEHFALEIADDGAGFDAAQARTRGLAGESIGLLGMEERVKLLGGRLTIDSAPGAGTRIRAEFALPDGGFG